MSIRKTYMAKRRNKLQIYAYVDGKPVLCEFRNPSSYNANIKGTFTTNNPALIEALDKNSGLNVKFVLKETMEDDSGKIENLEFRSLEVNPKVKEKEVKKPEVVKPPVKIPEPVKKETDETKPQEIVVGKDVVGNVQEAKEWLKNEFKGTQMRPLLNKKVVLEVAKEKNVRFEGVTE